MVTNPDNPAVSRRRYRVECEVWGQLTPDLARRLHAQGLEVRIREGTHDYISLLAHWPANSAVEVANLTAEVIRRAGLEGPIDLLVILPY